MPNWTSNRIEINGEDRDVRAFLEAVRSQDQLFDFNRIIPMPELLRRTGFGHQTIDDKKVSAWYVVHKGSPDVPEQVRLFTAEEETALKIIGYTNWYDWSNANWGTKWNACSVMVYGIPGYIEIAFDTAW